MCSLACQNVLTSLELLDKFDDKKIEPMREIEHQLDDAEDKLGTYLVKLSSSALSQKDSQVVSKMLHAIGNFERLGDHALNLKDCAAEMHEKGLSFTDEAKKEIKVLSAAIREILEITHRAYSENDVTMAQQVEPLEQVIDGLIAKIRANHIRRLRQGECSIEMGFVLADMLTNFERVSDHCSNVAVAVIEVEHNTFDTHHYLQDVKHTSADFQHAYADYKMKYTLA